jgi:hypothetical protein
MNSNLEQILKEMQEKLSIVTKTDFELANETVQTFHETIENEFQSEIVCKHSIPSQHKERFHSLFKLANGMIIEGLLIVHPENQGIRLEVKLREILS